MFPPVPRYATIDIGTNSVLLLVAEKEGPAHFAPIAERAEITRLGRGVDEQRLLSREGIDETVEAIGAFASEARSLGALEIAVCATSAARDARNSEELLSAARQRAGVEVEILPGELEGQLSFSAAVSDFGGPGLGPLVAIDIGGGSTEIIYGGTGKAFAVPTFRRSFDVGAVRLTERHVKHDPPSPAERARLEEVLEKSFLPLPPPPPGARAVGIAGTVTTLYAVLHEIEPYDAARVHGGTLLRSEIDELCSRLLSLPLAERSRLPGLQPKRADVICAGALVLRAALSQLGAPSCLVSDRGLRWGLLQHRFGGPVVP